ncbi:MAG: GAF domain-containing protein [Candidatus Sericytochromatia bacterium]|nr:GAF domain-containing protein [Candidatus Sericytochromatia bacterium]
MTFWGTRGSIAKPGAATIRYGGNTSCVQVMSDGGTLLILDAGTGLHGLGQHLLAQQKGPIRGHLLIGHTHWDHIQGIPFFAPLFANGNSWDVYAPAGFGQELRDVLAGQMEYAYFPVSLDQLGSRIRFHELREERLTIDDVSVSTMSLNHPAATLAYRLECRGASLVYATDHEPHAHATAVPAESPAGFVHPGDRRHVAFVAGADLLIHDAQYLAEEYGGRAGWGHSTVEYVVDVAVAAGVGKLALFHHDPMRSDDGVDALLGRARDLARQSGSTCEIVAAAEGATLVVERTGEAPEAPSVEVRRVLRSRLSSPTHPPEVVLAVDEPEIRSVVAAVLGQCGIICREAPVPSGTIDAGAVWIVSPSAWPVVTGHPGVVILPEAQERAWLTQTDRDHVLDVVTWPCSTQYLRARVEAWMMHRQPRWTRAPLPDQEVLRLKGVAALGLLDTPADERFERLTRLVRRAFGVPVAVVSLIDSDRQWFKTPSAYLASECARDVSLCAHAILREDPLIIEDLAADPQHGDNPAYTERRLRFYAGVPLRDADGWAVGTLCLMHVQPRRFSDEDVRLLKDFANLAEEELARRLADPAPLS